MQFTERTVFITGAAGNLGRCVAASFTQLGANLVLADMDIEPLERDGYVNGAKVQLTKVNLLNQVQVDKCVTRAVQQFGSIDVLCNLAGRYMAGDAVHLTNNSTWDYLQELNVGTILHTVHAVVPHMLQQRGGKIINVSAIAALHASAGMGAYAAAKSGVMRLTEAMADELQHKHINVNCVLPGILDTPENRAAMPDADYTRWVGLTPLTDVIVFLASSAARAVNGAMLPVRGRG